MRKFEKLQTAQLDYARKLVKATFPKFSRWKAINKDDEDHFGPCVWGELELDDDVLGPRRFYVTLSEISSLFSALLTGSTI